MHPMTLSQLELIPWYVCGVYFAVSLFDMKATQQEEPIGSKILRYAPTILAALLIFDRRFRVGVLGMRFMPEAIWAQITGIVLTFIGVAFTIWARASLGGNWSPDVTVKAGHELILSGPYARVRHPLYTGLTLAFAGAALEVGEWRAILAFAIWLVTHIIKAKQEEKLMYSQFGEKYVEYSKQSGFLIPRFR
jgi:protein-S-isoprenylcysteine O-methyltransferase Ste14